MFNISKKYIDFIIQFEGFSSNLYICPGGYNTIGFGHVIQPHENFIKLDLREALELLKQDLEFISNKLSKFVSIQLNEFQYLAILSLTFNIGLGAFQRSVLRQKINRGEFSEIPGEFLKWVRASGRILPGLVKRRLAEANLSNLKR